MQTITWTIIAILLTGCSTTRIPVPHGAPDHIDERCMLVYTTEKNACVVLDWSKHPSTPGGEKETVCKSEPGKVRYCHSFNYTQAKRLSESVPVPMKSGETFFLMSLASMSDLVQYIVRYIDPVKAFDEFKFIQDLTRENYVLRY